MRLLGNILWFLLGGWLLFLLYALAAILFFPMFLPLWRLALYSVWPFGRDVISQNKLTAYREQSGKSVESSSTVSVVRNVSGFLNVIWMLTFGWVLALVHLFASIGNLLLFFFIVTIPNIAGHWKLISVAFMPFNKVILPTEIVNEINQELARAKHNL